MKTVNCEQLDFTAIGARLRDAKGEMTLTGCKGQRFIAAGASDKTIDIHGVPGNALGAYLNGAEITVHANAQDAVGDTMNEGKIVVHGSVGDAVGYAMRGGKIFIRDGAGYRAGIHMKAYEDKIPAMVIGGKAGSFLGEYQAGGIIVVLGLSQNDAPIVGNFPCTGMHGGKIFLRGDVSGIDLPAGVTPRAATPEDMAELTPLVAEYCAHFAGDAAEILATPFTVITPDSKNPYKQMYVAN